MSLASYRTAPPRVIVTSVIVPVTYRTSRGGGLNRGKYPADLSFPGLDDPPSRRHPTVANDGNNCTILKLPDRRNSRADRDFMLGPDYSNARLNVSFSRTMAKAGIGKSMDNRPVFDAIGNVLPWLGMCPLPRGIRDSPSGK